MNPIISIVVPIWNAAKTLRKCVLSVFSQTFTDWELILSDDGSTDESLEICYSLSSECDKVRIFSNKHLGVSHARNVGLDHARGEYVCFVDADDTIDSDYLEVLYAHRAFDMVVCGYWVDWSNEKGNVIKSQEYCQKESLYCFNEREEMKNLFVSGIMHMNWNKLFKKELIDIFSIRYKPYPVNEDFIFMMEYLLHCKNLYVVGKATYHWVRVENIRSGVESLPKNTLDIYRQSHELLRRFFTCDESIADEIMYYSYELIIIKCLKTIKNIGPCNLEARYVLREIDKSDLVKHSFLSHRTSSIGEMFSCLMLRLKLYKVYMSLFLR